MPREMFGVLMKWHSRLRRSMKVERTRIKTFEKHGNDLKIDIELSHQLDDLQQGVVVKGVIIGSRICLRHYGAYHQVEQQA